MLRRGRSGPSTQEKVGEKRDGLWPLGEAGEFYFNKVRLEIKATMAGACMQPAPVRVESTQHSSWASKGSENHLQCILRLGVPGDIHRGLLA